MADVYCPKCGEPVDTYEFHDIAEADDVPYSVVAANFRADGCKALGMKCNTPDPTRAAAAAAMYDLLGDDMDGAASMLDDFEYLGMLD